MSDDRSRGEDGALTPRSRTALLRLLVTVSWGDYRTAPGRLALMIGGIATGVALIAALGIINRSVLTSFRAMLDRAAGKAALQVELGTGEIGFDEAHLDAVRADPDVVNAFGLVRGTLHAADASGEVLQLFGVDLVSEGLDSYDVQIARRDGDELETLNDPTSVFLTGELARRENIQVGDRVDFATPTGVQSLRVRGLLRAEGLATVFGGNLAVMDLPAAQRLLGKDRRIDQIDVVLRTDAPVEPVRQRLTAALPGSLTITRPALRGERFERSIAAFQGMLDGLSLLCLLAGIFIVYNTSATGITQRARDLAVLLTLGAERRTIFALVICEAAIIGALASAAGIGLGIGLAHALTGLVSQSMGVIYQMRFPIDSLWLSGAQVLAYLALGTSAAIAAALAPARKASRIDPLDLMRADFRERLSVTSPDRLLLGIWLALIVAAVAAVALEQAHRSITWGNVAATLWWLSAVVVSIPLMGWISRAMQRLLPRWFGLPGRIAAVGLTRSPGRTGVTTAVIALSLTLAVTVASVAGSFRESERNWFILSGDLVVSAIGTEGGWMESPLSPRVADLLSALPGVARIETYRVLQGQQYSGARIALVALSAGFADTPEFRRAVAAGDPDEVVLALRENRGAVVSDNLADQFDLHVGDDISLPAPDGWVTWPIRGIVTADYSGDQGSVIVHRDRLLAGWRDDLVSHFNLWLRPDADLEETRAAVVRALRHDYRVKVLTVPQTLAYHQGMVDRAFAFTYAIQLLVVVVTLAGIVDLLTTQIIERRREIGVLRVVGAEDAIIARAIWLEGLTIGVSGALLGVALSVGTSLLWVHVNFRILIGYILEHHFALATAIWCVVLAASVATMAARLAGGRALRQPILDILRQE